MTALPPSHIIIVRELLIITQRCTKSAITYSSMRYNSLVFLVLVSMKQRKNKIKNEELLVLERLNFEIALSVRVFFLSNSRAEIKNNFLICKSVLFSHVHRYLAI